MRILFIQLESHLIERMGVMYLSTALNAQSHEVRLALAARAGYRRLHKIMQDFEPRIVAFSTMTGEHLKLLEISRTLKRRHHFLAVFGGPHATFHPRLIEEAGCDALCVGEGDLAFPEFCRRLEQGQEHWKTPNFVIEHEGALFSNPPMPLARDLDALGFPDRGLIYDADPDLEAETNKMFLASRGCPYQCSYCFNCEYNAIYSGKGPVMRHRSPEHLVDEIARVRSRHPLKLVWINDDIFLIKPKGWIERFCDLYQDRIALPIICNVRADLVSEEVVRRLHDAGLIGAGMGIECGDEDVANTILSRNLTTSRIREAARTLKRNEIGIWAQSLTGLPVENSYETDLKTLDLNIEIAPFFAWSSLLLPYPGTPIHDYAVRHGFLDASDPVDLETNKRSSALTFGSPEEKRKVENLHKLFGLIVRFPFLRRHSDLLCSLPLTPLYSALFYLCYGYYWRRAMHPSESLTERGTKYLRVFLRMVRKS